MKATNPPSAAQSVIDTPVLVERDGGPEGVVTVRLNRPDRLNAMNDDLLDRLQLEVETVVADPDVRVIVLTGTGRGFCVGGDLQGFKDDGSSPDPTRAEQVARLRAHMSVVELLRSAPAISVAAVNGPCAGAGLGLALACDLRIAREGAVFRSAFVDAGLSGDFGGTWLLTRILGEAKAKELYLLNDKVSAQEALGIGLVSAVHPAEAFDAEVADLVSRLAGKAPVALRHIKRNLDDAARVDFARACELEAERHVDSYRTEDRVEAATAFLERRSPRFLGR